MKTARTFQVGVAVAALVVGMAGPAAAQPAAPAAATGPAAAPHDATGAAGGRSAGAQTYQITLVTGDVARLTVLPDGRRSAVLAGRDGKVPAYHIGEFEGDLYLIPQQAYPYVSSGQLDRRLFNLTGLVAQGYHDGAEPLHLMLAGRRPSAVPETPDAATEGVTLRSIGAVAVTPRAGRMATFWESIDDDDPSDGLRLTGGVGKVWLDGRVRATLDESVPQIGAPEAWRAGYDGDGVRVAVLDSGYDPKHPDLAEAVVEAESFVPEETVVDGNGHGTHVASTVAGSGSASGGSHKGVAPGADLMIGKVLNNSGSGADSWVIAGMEWAAAEGAQVISMSLGGWFPSDGTDPMSQAVDRLSAESGALFVIAAGNDGRLGMPWITSPGAASSALTVGAVDSDDQLADFSSRGPRERDGAVKPEVTAPGVGIVAARAAGTDVGLIVDEHYTTLNGTSMATPHVAGAAAILAQRHPDWSGDQIKSMLTATADPTPQTPVTDQGAGRIDVAAALGDVTVDTATLNLGELSWSDPRPEPVTREVSYRNTSDRPVRLRLRHDVATPAGVRAGLTVSPDTVAIAPGEAATVTVTLDPNGSEAGSYSGVLTATGSGVTLRTPVGFELHGKMHKLVVTATNREGQPHQFDFFSRVDVWDVATGRFRAPEPFGDNWERTVFLLPTGRYAVMAYIFSFDADWLPDSVSLVGEPDLQVTGNTELHLDARTAVPVSVETPKRAEPTQYGYFWRRAVDGRSTMSGWRLSADMTRDVYVQRFDKVRYGEFQVGHRWDLELPPLTVDVAGPDGFRLASPRLDPYGRRYVGEERLRLVNAGDGTPEELAAVDAADAVALVRWRGWDHLEGQFAAAADAKAKLLLLYREDPGYLVVRSDAIPVYTLESQEVAPLLRVLPDGGSVTVDVSGVANTPYRYSLMFSEDRITGPVHREVAERSLAAIDNAYHHHEGQPPLIAHRAAYLPDESIGMSLSYQVRPPARTTDYVNVRTGTDSLTWADGDFTALDPYRPITDDYALPETYRPGQQVSRDWSTAIVRPAVPDVEGDEQYGLPVARFHNAIRVAIPTYVSGDCQVYGWVDPTDSAHGDEYQTVDMVLRRDGTEVGRVASSVGQFPVPAAEADYELVLDVTRGPQVWPTTSVRTRTVWNFRSGEVAEREVLPLLQAAYRLDTDLANRLPAGEPGQLVVTPGYQPGAKGPGRFTVAVDVSYDDGSTWQAAPVSVSGSDSVVALPAAGEGAEHGSIRVTLTDSAGNRMEQTVIRAWHVA